MYIYECLLVVEICASSDQGVPAMFPVLNLKNDNVPAPEANFQCFWGSRSKKMIFKLQGLVFNVPGARTQKWRFSTIRNFFILSER